MVLQTLGASLFWWSVWLDARAYARSVCAGRPPLETRVVSLKALHANRVGDREIRLGGALYDIVRREPVTADSVRLIVYRDKKEERILASLPAFFSFPDAPAPHNPLHFWWQVWKASSFLAPVPPVLVVADEQERDACLFPAIRLPEGLNLPPDPDPPEAAVHSFS